jgi:protein arginine kinase activator
MLCENCKKNEATVHMTQAIGGRIQSIHLCEECAQAMGLDLHGGKLDMGKFLEGMGRHLQEVVEGLAKPKERSPADPPMPAACPLCGMRREEIRRRKIPGCPQCYETFAALLLDGDGERGWEYAGWVPKEYRVPAGKKAPKGERKAKSTSARDENRDAKVRECRLGLESAKRRLDAAVAAEHYEKAAELRDAIQALRHELESLGEPVEALSAGEAAQP